MEIWKLTVPIHSRDSDLLMYAQINNFHQFSRNLELICLSAAPQNWHNTQGPTDIRGIASKAMILAGGQKGSKTIENIFKAFFIWLTLLRPPALPTTELKRKAPPSWMSTSGQYLRMELKAIMESLLYSCIDLLSRETILNQQWMCSSHAQGWNPKKIRCV